VFWLNNSATTKPVLLKEKNKRKIIKKRDYLEEMCTFAVGNI
jgi:hypothetical protein